MAFSIGTEFVKNKEDIEKMNSKKESDKAKQDCEIKAFKRLAPKIKARFPKLPIIAAGDALYSKASVLDVCKENSWKYIIRFKKGTIPSLFEDFEEIVELENETTIPGYELARNMEYKGHKMNIVRYKEKEDEKAKKKSKKKKSLVILLLMTLMNLH